MEIFPKSISRVGWILVIISSFLLMTGGPALGSAAWSALDSGADDNPFLTVALVYILLSALGVASGVGLIRRQRWSRFPTVFLLSLPVLYFAGWLFALPFLLFDVEFDSSDELIELAGIVAALLLALSVTIWCIYTIRLLLSDRGKDEFGA